MTQVLPFIPRSELQLGVFVEPTREVHHGTESGYKWGCRMECCRDAVRIARAHRRGTAGIPRTARFCLLCGNRLGHDRVTVAGEQVHRACAVLYALQAAGIASVVSQGGQGLNGPPQGSGGL